ncbi:MAG: WG repeat-containing protein [Salibacteraceae bacterium]
MLRYGFAMFFYWMVMLPALGQDSYITKDNASCLYGLLDEEGNWKVSPRYESMEEVWNGYIVVEAGLFGVIDRNGRELIPAVHFRLDALTGKYYQLQSERGRCGVIDTNSQVILPLEYDQISMVAQSQRAMRLHQDGKYGLFIPGKTLLSPQYEGIINIWGQLVEISTASAEGIYHRGLIHYNGDTIVPPTANANFGVDHNDLIAVEWPETQLEGMVDTTGKIIVPYKYERIQALYYNRPGPYILPQKGKVFLIDVNGKRIGKQKFNRVYSTYAGITAIAKKGKQFGLINSVGAWVCPPQFDAITPFKRGSPDRYIYRSAKQGGYWGIIDADGSWRTLPRFDAIVWRNEYRRELAFGMRNDTVFVINPVQQKVINPKVGYEWKKHFSFARSTANFGDRMKGIVSDEGTLGLPPSAQDIQRSDKGYFMVKEPGSEKQGLLSPTLKWSIPSEKFTAFGLPVHPEIDSYAEIYFPSASWVRGSNQKAGIWDLNGGLLVDTLFGGVLNYPAFFDSLFQPCYWVGGFQENTWGVWSPENGLIIDTAFAQPSDWLLLPSGDEASINTTDGFSGLIASKGDTLVPFIYEYLDWWTDEENLDEYESPYLLAKNSQGTGLLNVRGKEVIPLQFENLIAIQHQLVLGKTSDSLHLFFLDQPNQNKAYPLPLYQAMQADLLPTFVDNDFKLLSIAEGQLDEEKSISWPKSWPDWRKRPINHYLLQQWIEAIAETASSTESILHSDRLSEWRDWEAQVYFVNREVDENLRISWMYDHNYYYSEEYRSAQIQSFTATTVSFFNYKETTWRRYHDVSETYETFTFEQNNMRQVQLSELFMEGFVSQFSRWCVENLGRLNDTLHSEERYEIDCSQPDALIESASVEWYLSEKGIWFSIVDSRQSGDTWYPNVEILLPWKQVAQWIDPQSPIAGYR